MPANRNALIRYKTIDTCLRNRYRQWTLDDLIQACSDALYEYEGIRKGISRRTVQMDIQMMRSEKLGYNAPIIVYDNKYYMYEDPEYSITNTPLSEQDLKIMSEAVEVLRQFKGFGYFNEMGEIVSRLEDHVTSARQKSNPVIDFEKNENLRGIHHLDVLYQAIVSKTALEITYQSFKARLASSFIFYPWLLKEYRNRWFIFGTKKDSHTLMNLALDRIHTILLLPNEHYKENDLFDPATFFNDTIGVTKTIGQKAHKIHFKVNSQNVPYIETKPFHHSQKVIERYPDGSALFFMEVVINFELQRELLAYSNAVQVLSPSPLVEDIAKKLSRAAHQYNNKE